jgi:hypothetical protein
VGEGADQRPHGDVDAEPIAVTQCGAGEEVQRVPEHGPLRRRSNQQLPVDRRGTVHAPPVQPLRVRIADAAQPPSDGGLGPPEPSGDGTVSAPAGMRDINKLDANGLDLILGAWTALRAVNPKEIRVIAVDGKSFRGSATAGGRCRHLLYRPPRRRGTPPSSCGGTQTMYWIAGIAGQTRRRPLG